MLSECRNSNGIRRSRVFWPKRSWSVPCKGRRPRRGRRSHSRSMLNFLIKTLLEPACVACQQVLARPLEGPVCDGCWRAVRRLTPPWCQRCGDALASWRPAHALCPRCRRQSSVIDMARSAGQYEGSLREILHAYKYGRRRTLAAPLARMMAEYGHDVLVGADAVVPVPLHPWRAFRRGFNQADELARHLGRPVWRVLARCAHGPPQAGLPAARRHANVKGAFGLRVLARVPIAGSTLVLIDDVMTTGATMRECAGVLKGAGVECVRGLTVARAVAARPVPLPRPHLLSIARRQ
jgi:ComF family protein